MENEVRCGIDINTTVFDDCLFDQMSGKINLGMIDFSEDGAKDKICRFLVKSMINRTMSMFKYKLPDTIPERSFKLQLLLNGHTEIIQKDGKFYSVVCGLGGKPDEYYMPTWAIMANPILGSKTYNIHKDCVVVPNDELYMGLVPLCRYYASQLVENTITKRLVTINSRMMYVLVAGDNDAYRDIQALYKDLADGKQKAILDETFDISNSMKSLPYTDSNASRLISGFIEHEQYLKASWFNDIGISYNYNMKRESITSTEAELGSDALSPFIDNMYNTQKRAFEEVKKIFGIDIDIEYDSSWKYFKEKLDIESNQLKQSIEQNKNSTQMETPKEENKDDTEPTEKTD